MTGLIDAGYICGVLKIRAMFLLNLVVAYADLEKYERKEEERGDHAKVIAEAMSMLVVGQAMRASKESCH